MRMGTRKIDLNVLIQGLATYVGNTPDTSTSFGAIVERTNQMRNICIFRARQQALNHHQSITAVSTSTCP